MSAFRSRHEALRLPPPEPKPRRQGPRVPEVLLAIAAFAAANAIAGFLTGPELYGPPGALDTLAARTSFPTPADEARARAVESFRQIIIYAALNTATASVLIYLVIARRLERKRRQFLGLPDGLDESLIDPNLDDPGGRPRSASEYRPSTN